MCLNTHRSVTADLTGGDICVAAKAQIQRKGGQFFIRDLVYRISHTRKGISLIYGSFIKRTAG